VYADSSLVRAVLGCDADGRIAMERLIEVQPGRHMPPASLELDNNILTVRSRSPQREIPVVLKRVYTNATHRQVITQTVEVNRLTRWQRTWMNIGKLLAAVTAVLLCFYVIKKIK